MLRTLKEMIWLLGALTLCMSALIFTLDYHTKQLLVLEGLVPFIQNQKASVHTRVWTNQVNPTLDIYSGVQILYSLQAWLDQGMALQVDQVQITAPEDSQTLLHNLIHLNRSYSCDRSYDDRGQLRSLSFYSL